MLKYVYSDDCECDQCRHVRVRVIEAIAEGQRQLDDASKKVGGSEHTRSGSALSRTSASAGVCDANMRDQVGTVHPNTQGDTHETHTHTHTDDASTCKHDGCDG